MQITLLASAGYGRPVRHLADVARANVRLPHVRCGLEDPREAKNKKNKVVGSTDWIASSLTRRFGLGAGLAYVGFLAFGVVSEQIKTRTEVALEAQGTRDVEGGGEEIVLENGIRYSDLTVGGGAAPRARDLVVVDLVGRSGGKTFVDTISKNRPLVFVFGAKPYSAGMCGGLELVLQSMNAGGKRKVFVPAELGFGEKGADFGGDAQVPPNSALDYTVWLRKVSIAP